MSFGAGSGFRFRRIKNPPSDAGARLLEENLSQNFYDPTSELLPGNENWYFGIFINPRTLSGVRAVLTSNSSNFSESGGFDLFSNGSDVSFRVRNSSNSVIATATLSTVLTPSSWTFLELYHNPVLGRIGLAANGSEFEVDTYNILLQSFAKGAGQFTVGDYSNGFGYWDGRLSRFGYWKGVSSILSDVNRILLYAAGLGLRYSDLPSALLTSLFSYYDADEIGNNDSLRDKKGGRDLTAVNSIRFGLGPSQ